MVEAHEARLGQGQRGALDTVGLCSHRKEDLGLGRGALGLQRFFVQGRNEGNTSGWRHALVWVQRLLF